MCALIGRKPMFYQSMRHRKTAVTKSGTGNWGLGRGCQDVGLGDMGLGDSETWDLGTRGCGTQGRGTPGRGDTTKLHSDEGEAIDNSKKMLVVIDPFAVRFTKLLNGFRSSFEIPEVRYTLDNFIT